MFSGARVFPGSCVLTPRVQTVTWFLVSSLRRGGIVFKVLRTNGRLGSLDLVRCFSFNLTGSSRNRSFKNKHSSGSVTVAAQTELT